MAVSEAWLRMLRKLDTVGKARARRSRRSGSSGACRYAAVLGDKAEDSRRLAPATRVVFPAEELNGCEVLMFLFLLVALPHPR